MSVLLRILICFSGLALIYMARKANIVRKMTERQSLFWIMGGLIIILFGVFPQLVYFISDSFSVEYPPSIIFAIAIILATYGIFSCYRTNAELSARVQELAMQVSLLNEENSHLKDILMKEIPGNNEKSTGENDLT
ncbi:DUF2304 domain-containing protein [Anaerocolumna sp. AGMB13020]|uniref:DUF2304 domain-containing protein n=1 Tax=Anaerocolumna sp. AGMB13020 TaxID=3081750 RepID=UPI002952F05C|nr:DUF2304 domain-containing protein [Anaerocolumna sp. AGMB13020]WOO36696.1 DUF2304 domain-containing protein [Anaerocolumna sp. AGMB13020]